MDVQYKFLALDEQDRFKFLYQAVKENERFIVKWLTDEHPSSAEEKRDSIECIHNSFDFLHKLIYPGIQKAPVINKELMLNGMADDLFSLSEEIADIESNKNVHRAVMGIAAIEALFTCIIDRFFSEGDYDVDNAPFQVVLLSAIGNYMGNEFEGFNAECAYALSWHDINALGSEFIKMETMLSTFMEGIFKSRYTKE